MKYTNENIKEIKVFADLAKTFSATISGAEKFEFADGRKIISVGFDVPEFKGGQFDEFTKVNFIVPAFSTIKMLDIDKDGFVKCFEFADNKEMFSKFYNDINNLVDEEKRCGSTAGWCALPYDREEADTHSFNNIRKEWRKFFN